MGVKLIFCVQIKIKVVYKLIVSLSDCIARHAQSTQKFPKFAVILQYLKKEGRDKVAFFCMQINILQVSYKLISTLWSSKCPTKDQTFSKYSK